MFRKKPGRFFVLVIAAFAILSMACGLLDRAVELVTDRGLDALSQSGVLEDTRLDLSRFETSGAEFLFEVDPFDDVIRWRFYAVDADLPDVGEYYLSQLSYYMVERDEVINGERYLVLSADHPLSGIYTQNGLEGLEPGYEDIESTLLDVEVLHSTAHAQTGRLGLSDAMDLLPSPVPMDTTLVILVYNRSSMDVGGIIEAVPGVISDSDQNGTVTDPDELTNGDDTERDDDGLNEFTDDDQTQELTNLTGVCSQVLGSGACYHPYIPVVEGFTRSYQTEGGITTETVTGVRDDGFTVVTETADGHTVSVDFDCTPEGMAGWKLDQSIMDTLEGVPTDVEFNIDIDIEGVQLPAEITAGDTWSALVTTTISIDAGDALSKNEILIELDYTAVGEETISTPGGRYTAMRIDFVSSGENTLVVTGDGGTFTQPLFTLEGSGSDWYVECLGKVRSVAYASWTGVSSVVSEVRMELIDFGVQ